MNYYGIDVHKKYSVFARMDEKGKILSEGRIDNTPEAVAAMLEPAQGEVQVVLEACGLWPWVYDLLEPHGVEITLAHPQRVKAIAHAKVKTDKVDARTLAHLLRADLIPPAYVPPREIRELRELLRSRYAWTQQRTRAKNRVHGLLAKRGYRSPVKDLFGQKGRRWLAELPLDPVARTLVERELRLIDSLDSLIQEASGEIEERAKGDPRVQLLKTMPGVGYYTAMLLVAELGDVTRFPSAKQVVAYAGLAPRVRSSGGAVHIGRITKQGSPYLRWILTEAAHRAVRLSPYFRGLFLKKLVRRGLQRAMITVTRKFLSMAYGILKHHRPYEEPRGQTSTSLLAG
jgi:transposase